MSSKRLVKRGGAALALAAIVYFVPVVGAILVAYLLVGLVDVSRHGRWDRSLLGTYFLGNGLLTWLISPLNLLFDLVSRRHPYCLSLSDFSEPAQAELSAVLDVFEARRDDITSSLRVRMKGRKRGMLFYKWYDRNADPSVPEFSRQYDHVKTIGVSVFNSRVETSRHFGPLRLTVRVLYNLTPRRSENIYIEVNGEKHYWHDDPLFIFDDTIQHVSVNREEGERFCVFMDVLRPSPVMRLQNIGIGVMGTLLAGVNRIFYKNWDMLAPSPHPEV